MKELLWFLEMITPLWLVSVTGALVIIAYIYKFSRSGGWVAAILSDGPVLLSCITIATSYALFYMFDVPIEVRGPLVRFELQSLLVFLAINAIMTPGEPQ